MDSHHFQSDQLRRLVGRGIILSACAIWITACPQKTEVWIPAGSTTRNLTFIFGKERTVEKEIAFGGIQVFKCEDLRSDLTQQEAVRRAVWWILTPSAAPGMSRIKYGESPAGFQTIAAPKALEPGCYHVGIDGTGVTNFRVASDGKVTELAERR